MDKRAALLLKGGFAFFKTAPNPTASALLLLSAPSWLEGSACLPFTASAEDQTCHKNSGHSNGSSPNSLWKWQFR